MRNQATLEPRSRSIAARVRSWLLGEGDAPPVPEHTARATAALLVLPDPAVALQAAWRAHSLGTSWCSAADWWDPACDAMVETFVTSGVEPHSVLARLGRARAELGCTIEETLDDLAALHAAAGAGDPSLASVRALVSGWAEAGLRQVGTASCFDSVTGLTTRAYLQARLAEQYRDARPGHPADRLCLVVVDIGVPGTLDGLPVLHRTSEALRRTFTHGSTLARIGTGRFLAVAPIGPGLPVTLTALENLLADHEEDVAVSAACVWVESLPHTYGLVHGLLDDLAR